MNLFDIRRRLLNCGGGFPAEPSAYTLIEKYTATQTWTAPENGYFQIEVFGASGNGGSGKAYCRTRVDATIGAVTIRQHAGGGGGGGGAYACSRIMMKKGDTIELVCGAVGADSSANITSSMESYDVMNVTSGSNGGNASSATVYGTGSAGGTANGGNYANANGKTGGDGKYSASSSASIAGSGGAAGYTGGNAGGAGGAGTHSTSGSTKTYAGGAGGAGFINIYRGDTNVVA